MRIFALLARHDATQLLGIIPQHAGLPLKASALACAALPNTNRQRFRTPDALLAFRDGP